MRCEKEREKAFAMSRHALHTNHVALDFAPSLNSPYSHNFLPDFFVSIREALLFRIETNKNISANIFIPSAIPGFARCGRSKWIDGDSLKWKCEMLTLPRGSVCVWANSFRRSNKNDNYCLSCSNNKHWAMRLLPLYALLFLSRRWICVQLFIKCFSMTFPAFWMRIEAGEKRNRIEKCWRIIGRATYTFFIIRESSYATIVH